MKILVSVILAFLFIGCSDNAKEEVQKAKAVELAQEVSAATTKAVEEVKMQAAKDVVEAKAEITQIDKEITPVVKKAVEEVKAQAAKEATVVEKKVDEVKAVAAAAEPSLDSGKAIFMVCAGCHGTNAEKAALGKSQIIKGWSVAKVSDALNGYKAGTYGGVMKTVMKGQASKLSDADIKAVAGYISSL